MVLRAECLAPVAAELGEGPVWRAESCEVLWVDILRGEVHASDLDGVDEIRLPGDPERQQLARKSVGGITLDEGNFSQLATLAQLLGVDLPE